MVAMQARVVAGPAVAASSPQLSWAALVVLLPPPAARGRDRKCRSCCDVAALTQRRASDRAGAVDPGAGGVADVLATAVEVAIVCVVLALVVRTRLLAATGAAL